MSTRQRPPKKERDSYKLAKAVLNSDPEAWRLAEEILDRAEKLRRIPITRKYPRKD